jgi:hypothetical protein
MEQSVEKIIERNLLEVLNGRDEGSRRAAIDELWNKDGVFKDRDRAFPRSRWPPAAWNTDACHGRPSP